MNTSSQLHEQARNNYNRLSRWYDLMSGEKEYKLSVGMLKNLCLSPNNVLLDMGCGTGRLLVAALAEMDNLGLVIGVDVSEGMCSMAKARLARFGLTTRSLVIHGDACSLSIADESLDAITMTFSLELFNEPDILNVLHECIRILKPGGRLGIVSMSALDHPSLPDRIYRLSHQIAPLIIDCRPINLEMLLSNLNQKIKSFKQEKLWGLSVAEGIIEKI